MARRKTVRKAPRKFASKSLLARLPLLKLAGWGFAAFLLMIVYFGYDLPDAARAKPQDISPSITILAHDGSLVARYGGLKGDVVKAEDLPEHVRHAVLAIEDRRFYSHFGIDPFGLARAMFENVKAGRFVQGGSTITQQLAKNLFLTPDKTIRRKVQEALLALQIERRYTKDEILTAYLNRVYFGAGAYGIDGAARIYFKKRARDLTLWEGAVLAGLLKAPSRFSPAANPDLAAKRASVVIRAMEDAGFITEKEMGREISKLDRGIDRDADTGEGRYFADWILAQIDGFVANNDGGLVVKTTLHPRLQQLAEARIAAVFDTLPETAKIGQAALVTLARDGAVLAMAGGRDYRKSQFNRATQALRQPGSAFKPFVFLAALEAGAAPGDIVEDAPINEGSYRPDNYDGKYYGVVTLSDALALSMNTATIRLLQAVGTGRFVDVLRRFNFPQKFRGELAEGLGATETTLLDLVNAYAMIANGGHSISPYGVLSITDDAGNVLYNAEPASHPQVVSGTAVSHIDSMLVQVVARGTGQAAQLSRGHVAGKTGTSQNYRDAWFIGYTDRLITGVWMGNDDNKPMNRVSGGGQPARLWRDYMTGAIDVGLPDYAAADVSGSYAAPTVGGFVDMLNQWAAGYDAPADSGRVRPSNVPVYNQ